MGFYVGIDLGTTNSTVSVIRTEDYEDNPLDCLETCPIYQYGEEKYGEKIGQYEMGEICLPSDLYFNIDNKRVYTGLFAKMRYASGDYPLQTVRSVKTRMGRESIVKIPSIEEPDKTESFDMVQCSSFFIRTIVDSLKKQFPDEDVTRQAVVTVPAAFNDDERVATRNAVLLGGFKECIILDEPTAALLSYMNTESDDFDDDSLDEDEVAYKLVYDIGGGTLDVSIAEVTMDEDGNYSIDVKGLSERMNLGGDDFDRLLGAYFLKEFEASEEPIDTRSVEDQNRIIARIVSNAENYKIELNERIQECNGDERKIKRLRLKVAFELIDGMFVSGISITKQILDEIYAVFTNPHSTKGLITPIETALKSADIQKDQITEVILTGGMSNFYAVRETLRSYFGSEIPIEMIDDTRTAVSRGAALYHWGLDEDNESEDVKRLNSISNKLSSNIYIRNNGAFHILIPSDLHTTRGSYDYIIEDDMVPYLPLFLYSGNEDTDVTKFIQLTGRMIPLKPEYRKGQTLKLNWSINEDKVITIEVENDKDLTLSRILTPKKVEENLVQSYTVNPVKD